MKRSLSRAAKRLRAQSRRLRLAEFLKDVVPNNKHRPGWNRAEDLGTTPEHLPEGTLVRWSEGFRDGKSSGRRITKPVVIWRY